MRHSLLVSPNRGMKFYPIFNLFSQADDKTLYAQSLGYTEDRKVFVLDGKVISHRSVGWFDFTAALRSRQKQQHQ